jgi:hypothetical protein
MQESFRRRPGHQIGDADLNMRENFGGVNSWFAETGHQSGDVSADIAQELRRRCDLQMHDVPYNIHQFVEQHYGLDRQLSLRLA